MIKLTENQRRLLHSQEHEEEPGLEDYVVRDEYLLGMDSHGCNCYIVPFRKLGGDALYGFMVRCSSEECFYEDEEIYELKEKYVMVTEYEPTNYERWVW